MASTRSSVADPGIVTRSRARTNGVTATKEQRNESGAKKNNKATAAAAAPPPPPSKTDVADDVENDGIASDASLDAFDPETRAAVDQLLEAVPDASALSSPNPRVAEAARKALAALYKYSLRTASRAAASNGAGNAAAAAAAAAMTVTTTSSGPSSSTAAPSLPPGVLPELYAGPGFDVEQVSIFC